MIPKTLKIILTVPTCRDSAFKPKVGSQTKELCFENTEMFPATSVKMFP